MKNITKTDLVHLLNELIANGDLLIFLPPKRLEQIAKDGDVLLDSDDIAFACMNGPNSIQISVADQRKEPEEDNCIGCGEPVEG